MPIRGPIRSRLQPRQVHVTNRAAALALAAFLLVSFSGLPASALLSASQLSARLKEAVDKRSSVDLYVLSDEVLVVLSSDGELPADVMKKDAAAAAQVVGQDADLRARRLKVVFAARGAGDKVKEVSFTKEQLAAEPDLSKIALAQAERIVAEPANIYTQGAPTAKTRVMGAGDFTSARQKLVSRLQSLQNKGVGVTPYYKELAKADEFYKKADVPAATALLGRLDKLVLDQEEHLKKMHQASVSTSQVSQAPAPAAAGRAGYDSLAEFTGGADAYYDQVAAQILQRELGDLAPCDGPFRLERFRLAKRIQELQGRGTNVEGYKAYYRKIEDLARSKDNRRLNELGDNIRYLQSQLGLTALQGGRSR